MKGTINIINMTITILGMMDDSDSDSDGDGDGDDDELHLLKGDLEGACLEGARFVPCVLLLVVGGVAIILCKDVEVIMGVGVLMTMTTTMLLRCHP